MQLQRIHKLLAGFWGQTERFINDLNLLRHVKASDWWWQTTGASCRCQTTAIMQAHGQVCVWRGAISGAVQMHVNTTSRRPAMRVMTLTGAWATSTRSSLGNRDGAELTGLFRTGLRSRCENSKSNDELATIAFARRRSNYTVRSIRSDSYNVCTVVCSPRLQRPMASCTAVCGAVLCDAEWEMLRRQSRTEIRVSGAFEARRQALLPSALTCSCTKHFWCKLASTNESSKDHFF